ncbi:MAG: T9SS type A sorting domain-containing protein, partial [Cytophagaceae bacterium]
DFQHSCHFYKNTGSNNAPVLSHQQDDFLQNTMVDVGENAAPAFADYDADGDLDMFAGNRGLYYGPGFSASINLFLNTGTNSNPSYTLINEDYLNFSTLGFTYIRPAFTDINGDNSTDLVFAAYNSSSAYTIQYIPNTNAAGTPYAYNPASMTTLPVSPGHEDSPCFYDVDGDLDLDILMARANGNLAYFENTGSNASPSYTQVTNTFGGITVDGPHNRIYLTLTVMDADADGNPDLVTADNTGRLRYYSDFLSNINGTFTPIDIQVDSSLTYNLGKILYLTNADLNNDGKKELIIGSNTGGLICLNTSATHINVSAITKSSLLLEDIMLFPNPANQDLTISAPYQGHFSLIDIYGRTVKDEQSFVKNTPQSVSLDDLPSGIYFLRFETDDHRSAMKKIVVQK